MPTQDGRSSHSQRRHPRRSARRKLWGLNVQPSGGGTFTGGQQPPRLCTADFVSSGSRRRASVAHLALASGPSSDARGTPHQLYDAAVTDNSADEYQVPIICDGIQTTWSLHVINETYPHLTLVLTAPDRTWTATGVSVFAALMDLREQLDAEQIRLCCNGARRNAWSSGMQQDMGRGYSVYLLEANQPGRPTDVRTLDPAPCDQIATVQEQKDWYSSWLAKRRNHSD